MLAGCIFALIMNQSSSMIHSKNVNHTRSSREVMPSAYKKSSSSLSIQQAFFPSPTSSTSSFFIICATSEPHSFIVSTQIKQESLVQLGKLASSAPRSWHQAASALPTSATSIILLFWCRFTSIFLTVIFLTFNHSDYLPWFLNCARMGVSDNS